MYTTRGLGGHFQISNDRSAESADELAAAVEKNLAASSYDVTQFFLGRLLYTARTNYGRARDWPTEIESSHYRTILHHVVYDTVYFWKDRSVVKRRVIIRITVTT